MKVSIYYVKISEFNRALRTTDFNLDSTISTARTPSTTLTTANTTAITTTTTTTTTTTGARCDPFG